MKKDLQSVRINFLMFGILCVAIFPQQTIASNNPSITIDINDNKTMTDYDQLSEFVKTQDDPQPKYFATDDKQVIFSQKPIVLTVFAKHVYFPTHLANLGLKMNIDNHQLKPIIIKVQSYQLVSKEIYQLPEFEKEES